VIPDVPQTPLSLTFVTHSAAVFAGHRTPTTAACRTVIRKEISLSFSIGTLQDFVVNLIDDDAAMAAYTADPHGALAAAGLADLTPADVQEVLPLVADSIPVTDGLPAGLPDLDGLPGLGDLPHGLPGLGDGLPGLGDGLPELGDLPVELPSLEVPDLPGLPADADLTGKLNEEGAYAAADLDSAIGGLAAAGSVSDAGIGGAASACTDLADADLGFAGSTSGSLVAQGELDTIAGDLSGGLTVSHEGVALAVDSPLADLAATSAGDLAINPVDTADLLDVDHLGDTGDAVAGTVAHYVSAGTVTVTDGVDYGADTLAGFLTGPAAPVADAVQTGAGTVTDGLEHGSETVTGHLDDLPSLDDLPVGDLPELPQLPDLPTIDSNDLPVGDVAGHLPVDLPELPHLPVDLPDTSAVTGLVSDNPVTDAVQAGPVGGLVDDVTGHLPRVADLDLGL
jgi:hypothetical protein